MTTTSSLGGEVSTLGRFQRQPATIARTAEHYYELRADGIVPIGSATKDALIRWARTHGFAPSFIDERKRELRAEVWGLSK
jgi:hypothetical protein